MGAYVYLFRATDASRRDALGTPERAQQSMEAWLAWVRDLEAKGHLKDPGQPLDSAGRTVRGTVVSDGPFAEAKDIVLGFMVIEARDITEAVELSMRCPMVMGGGSIEIRPVMKLAG